jgi:hypothetical protein
LNVAVGDKPAITAQPTSRIVTNGALTTFTVAADGSTNLFYQWRLNGANINGATGTSFTRNPVTNSHGGSYTVVVSNVVSTVTSSAATLTVATPPVITVEPTNKTFTAGTAATMSVTVSGTAPLVYRWLLEGVPVSGATAATLTIPVAQTTNSGSYSVIVTNSVGAVTSAPAVLTINVPTPTIKTPAQGTTVTNNWASFTGTAPTNARITQVLYRTGTNAFAPVTGLANWSITASNLVAGTNIFEVKAVDQSAQESAAATRVVFYSSYDIFTLLTSGNGSIIPIEDIESPTNQANLVVGKRYKITAVPGTNWLLTNWTYSIDGGAPNTLLATNILKFNFLMESNLAIRANFITNPYLANAGLYNGLFAETNGLRRQSAGFTTIKVTPKLAFSSKFYVDGDTFSASGKINLPGDASKTILRTKQGKNPLLVNLQMGFAAAAPDQIIGTIEDATAGWVAEITADRWITNNMHAYSNLYTLAIPPPFSDPASGPVGYGHLLISVSDLGKVKAAGRTADGEKISQAVPLSRFGDWPFFQHLYKYSNIVAAVTNKEMQGLVMGSLAFETNTPAGTVNLAPLGGVSWIKKGWTNGIYDSGFTNDLTVISSRMVQKPIGQRAVTLVHNRIVMSGGNLPSNATNSVNLATNNAVTFALPNLNTTKPGIDPKKGGLKGSFLNPAKPLKPTAIQGVILQDYNYGRGHFVGTNAGGFIKLE